MLSQMGNISTLPSYALWRSLVGMYRRLNSLDCELFKGLLIEAKDTYSCLGFTPFIAEV